MANTIQLDLELMEQFKKDCTVFKLKKEYPDYDGTEKWAVITDLSEKELLEKHCEVIKRYVPYLLLTVEQGKAIRDYIRIEDKYRKRGSNVDSFGYDDELTAVFHPELIGLDYWDELEETERAEKRAALLTRLPEAIENLSDVQKKRLKAHFFDGRTTRDIAEEEGVSHTAIVHSIDAALKNLKKFLK